MTRTRSHRVLWAQRGLGLLLAATGRPTGVLSRGWERAVAGFWMYLGVALTELAMGAQIQSRPPLRRFRMSFSGSSS